MFSKRNNQMVILRATIYGTIRGVKLYKLPTKKKAKQILKSEAKIQNKLSEDFFLEDKIVKLHEGLLLESPRCPAVALIMDFYEHGSYALQIKRRAYHNIRFQELEILTIFYRL